MLRRTRTRALWLSGSLLLAPGCASQPPPAPVAIAAAAPAPPPPPPDITAVPAPSSLVLLFRLSKPAASSRVVTDWARLPALDPATVLEGALDGVAKRGGLVGGPDNSALAHAIDTALPIDVAVAFDPIASMEPMFAISAAVTQLDAARDALSARFDVAPADGGVIRLHPKSRPGQDKSTEEDPPGECELSPSAGAAPYRLVCGSSRAALGALGAYLARTTPRQTFDADLHVEMRAGPMKAAAMLGRLQAPKVIGSLLGLTSATDPATLELVHAGLGDLFDYVTDFDAFTFDLALDPAQATLSMKSTFKSANSLMARLATAHPDQGDLPPTTFLRLPLDVDLATFNGAIDPAELQHPRDLLVAALTEQLGKAKLAPSDARAVAELLKGGRMGVRALLAHGVAAIPVDKLAKVDADTTASYWLYERDEGAAPLDKLARGIVAAVNRPGVAKAWKDHLPSRPAPSIRIAAAPAGAIAGTLHLQVTTFGETPGPSTPPGASLGGAKLAKPKLEVKVAAPDPPRTYHVLIVPDGPRSWVAISTNETVAMSKVALAVAGHSGSDTLAARAGLESFRETRMASGGFFTVGSFAALAEDMMRAMPGSKHIDWRRVLRSLPSKGTTPIPFTSSAGDPTPEDPGGQRDARMTLPGDAIRDAIRVLMSLD